MKKVKMIAGLCITVLGLALILGIEGATTILQMLIQATAGAAIMFVGADYTKYVIGTDYEH